MFGVDSYQSIAVNRHSAGSTCLLAPDDLRTFIGKGGLSAPLSRALVARHALTIGALAGKLPVQYPIARGRGVIGNQGME
jgi:hypothetical protein